MGIAARELSQFVIRPTLLYLGQDNPDAEALLLGIAAASQSHLGSALHDRHGYGLYCIRELRHAALWDQYLAHDPDLASLVRGLASQHVPVQPSSGADGQFALRHGHCLVFWSSNKK